MSTLEDDKEAKIRQIKARMRRKVLFIFLIILICTFLLGLILGIVASAHLASPL